MTREDSKPPRAHTAAQGRDRVRQRTRARGLRRDRHPVPWRHLGAIADVGPPPRSRAWSASRGGACGWRRALDKLLPQRGPARPARRNAPIWPPIAGVLRPHSSARVARAPAVGGRQTTRLDRRQGWGLRARRRHVRGRALGRTRIGGDQELSRTLGPCRSTASRSSRARSGRATPCQTTPCTLVVGRSVLWAATLSSCWRLRLSAPLGAPAELATRRSWRRRPPAWKEARGGPAAVAQEPRTHGRRDPTAESRDPLAREGGVGVPPRVWWTLADVPTFAKMDRLKSLHLGPLAR